jgi:hypothetical protein
VPYIAHLLTVSALVWEDGGSQNEAIAGLFHDAVEHRATSLEEIREDFGKKVAAIVSQCRDVVSVDGRRPGPWFDRTIEHLADLRRLESAGLGSALRVVGAIELADVRVVLADHHRATPALWDRFAGGLGGCAWRVGSVATIVDDARPGSMLSTELRAAADDLEAIMAESAADRRWEGGDFAGILGTIAMRGPHDATRHLAFELTRATTARPADPQQACNTVMTRWFGPPRPDHEVD